MKIQYKIGDITQAEEEIIAHGCNCQGVMGSGVALAIRNAFPQAYKEYKSSYDQKSNQFKLGNTIIVYCNNKIIANCLTQTFYGRDGSKYVSYDAIQSCMNQLYNMAKIKNLKVALPLIGARLGGGDWNVISAIIESEFKDITPIVYVFNKEEMSKIDKNN